MLDEFEDVVITLGFPSEADIMSDRTPVAYIKHVIGATITLYIMSWDVTSEGVVYITECSDPTIRLMTMSQEPELLQRAVYKAHKQVPYVVSALIDRVWQNRNHPYPSELEPEDE